MQPMTQAFQTVEPAHPGLTTIKTTLYELVGAIIDEMQEGEDPLVVETLLDLQNTGRIRFRGAKPLDS
jgi:hypothetical protein